MRTHKYNISTIKSNMHCDPARLDHVATRNTQHLHTITLQADNTDWYVMRKRANKDRKLLPTTDPCQA